MKRPEGFDPPGKRPAAGGPAPRRGQAPPGTRRKPSEPAPQKAKPAKTQSGAPAQKEPGAKAPRQRPPERKRQPGRDQASGSRYERAEARKRARERKRFERKEVRRFTRRARNRRYAWLTAAGIAALLAGVVAVAVYSPILALRTIVIDGTARVSAEEVHAALEGQLGTPLALIDFAEVTEALGAFPLIRSFVTETVPPDTLRIHIVERQPVGAVREGGVYRLVDPAGIVVLESADPVPGVPVIELGGEDTSSDRFAAIVEVLLAMPADLLAQVDSISATTRDNVSLVLTGVGQQVSWGSAEDSERKAAVLAALIRITDPSRAGEFDVSAPGNGIFNPA